MNVRDALIQIKEYNLDDQTKRFGENGHVVTRGVLSRVIKFLHLDKIPYIKDLICKTDAAAVITNVKEMIVVHLNNIKDESEYLEAAALATQVATKADAFVGKIIDRRPEQTTLLNALQIKDPVSLYPQAMKDALARLVDPQPQPQQPQSPAPAPETEQTPEEQQQPPAATIQQEQPEQPEQPPVQEGADTGSANNEPPAAPAEQQPAAPSVDSDPILDDLDTPPSDGKNIVQVDVREEELPPAVAKQADVVAAPPVATKKGKGRGKQSQSAQKLSARLASDAAQKADGAKSKGKEPKSAQPK